MTIFYNHEVNHREDIDDDSHWREGDCINCLSTFIHNVVGVGPVMERGALMDGPSDIRSR